MSSLTIAYGALLILIGIISYLGSGRASVTALIPAFIGVPPLIIGLMARRPGMSRIAIIVVTVIAAVALVGSLQGLDELPDLLRGDDVERPWAVASQTLTAALSIFYLAFAVRALAGGEGRRGGVRSRP